jgi:hypothetical protein
MPIQDLDWNIGVEPAGLLLEHETTHTQLTLDLETSPSPGDDKLQDKEPEVLQALQQDYPDEEEKLAMAALISEEEMQKAYLNGLPNVALSPSARKIPVMYGLTREECGTSLSTESRFNGIWKYWNKYCLTLERPLVYMGFGLGLYAH